MAPGLMTCHCETASAVRNLLFDESVSRTYSGSLHPQSAGGTCAFRKLDTRV